MWLAATYTCVLVAIAIDFVSGVRKARMAGVKPRSRGYKMTCDKAVKYFLPMLCLSCIDFLASIFFAAPFLTMAMGAFNIFCEWKSVMESIHDKAEIPEAAETMRLIIENKDDLARAIADILGQMTAERKEADQ